MIKRTLVLTAAISCMISDVIAENVEDNIPTEGVFKFGDHKGYIKMPDNYSQAKKYPLILFFSGRGGSASYNNFTSVEFSEFRKKAAERGYAVAVPEYGSDCWFNEDAEKITLAMVDFISRKTSLNTQKLYIMGCSMGGGAALVFTARHPEKVRAVCDVFGITDMVRFYKEVPAYNGSISKAYGGTPDNREQYYKDRSAVNLLEKYEGIPFMIIHGEKDGTVTKSNSDILVRKMKDKKISVEYLTVKDVGHSNKIIDGLEDRVLDYFDAFK